jgi:molybdate/tungstate transport system substrate-binding protein
MTDQTRSPHPGGAKNFLEFMLAADGGLKVLNEMGQPPFVPARVSSIQVQSSLPANRPKLVEVKNRPFRLNRYLKM